MCFGSDVPKQKPIKIPDPQLPIMQPLAETQPSLPMEAPGAGQRRRSKASGIEVFATGVSGLPTIDSGSRNVGVTGV